MGLFLLIMTAKEYLLEITNDLDYCNQLTEGQCLEELIKSHKSLINTPEEIVYKYRKGHREDLIKLEKALDKLERINNILKG